MRCVTNGASFAQCSMLENERPRLLAMTLRASLIGASHGQAAGWLENIASVRVVALGASHVLFDKRMMLRQMKLGFGLPMALEAS